MAISYKLQSYLYRKVRYKMINTIDVNYKNLKKKLSIAL